MKPSTTETTRKSIHVYPNAWLNGKPSGQGQFDYNCMQRLGCIESLALDVRSGVDSLSTKVHLGTVAEASLENAGMWITCEQVHVWAPYASGESRENHEKVSLTFSPASAFTTRV